MLIFLFTDIEGSTELWTRYPHAMEAALAQHDTLLKGLITQHGGQVIKHTGDGLFVVFEGGEPLACAIAMQRALAQQDWGETGALRVRIALHTGVARKREADYFGLEVSRTARLLSAGWGGQILLSCELARAVALPAGATLYDLGNHLLKDLGEPQHIYQLQHVDLPAQQFPPLRTLTIHSHNLPAQSTPFIGRVQELREIATRLAEPTCRLLTLVGPGGMGKTRLALQAGAELVANFTHGVYFVPLAALTSSEFLIPAIADALHISFYHRDTLQTQLFNYLQEKQLLLILDNFEHIIAGAPLVAELRARAPGLKVLVTSRERLNVQGETLLSVAGLALPTVMPMAGELSEAEELFLQHAQRIDPALDLTAQRAAMARVCARLLGMPLALELAASWLRLLTCAEIEAELEHSFELLSSTMRDTPERHRSLRAVFEYSWQLLSEPEKRAAQMLAVFQGDFRREAALVVLRPSDAPASTVELLSLLAALVDKSLLQRRADGRYAMHTLLHQYTLEKLHAEPVLAEQVRRRHSDYYSAFLQQCQPELEGSQQLAALTAMAEGFEDVRAMWHWAAQQRDVSLLGSSLHSLALFMTMRGRFQEGIALFEVALAVLDALSTPEAAQLHGWLLAYRADFVSFCDEYERARELAEAALAVNQQLAALQAVAFTLTTLGRIAQQQNDYPRATVYYQQALEHNITAGNQSRQAQVLDQLGVLAWTQGNYTEARGYYERSLALYRAAENLYGIARVLDHLGVLARDTGDVETARDYLQQSHASLETLDARMLLAYTANHLAGVLAVLGDLPAAEPYFKQCIAIGKDLGERRTVAYALYDWGQMLGVQGDQETAQTMLEEALGVFETLGDQFGELIARVGLGELALEYEDLELARTYLLSAGRLEATLQNLWLLSQVLLGWVHYLSTIGDWELLVEILGYLRESGDELHYFESRVADWLEQAQTQLSAAAFAAALTRRQNATPAEMLQLVERHGLTRA